VTANLLSIAGSDPSGGAGIAADLKTFAALGGYGMAAISAITVQNTQGVHAVQALPAALVAAQATAVFDDVRVDAVKLGMLAEADTVRAVAAVLRARAARHVVLDPVLRASSGDTLAGAGMVAALREALLPQVELLTPNLAEAAALLDCAPAGALDAMVEQAQRLRALGPAWVLLKGGHLGGDRSPDVLAGPEGVDVFDAPRILTRAGHGTGCTLAAAIAALRPCHSMQSAVVRAKDYLQAALAAADRLQVGHGSGPLHHFHLQERGFSRR
jgi:hydroxymethylpyrimidine/phosphomethylpyrimidine kinase